MTFRLGNVFVFHLRLNASFLSETIPAFMKNNSEYHTQHFLDRFFKPIETHTDIPADSLDKSHKKQESFKVF